MNQRGSIVAVPFTSLGLLLLGPLAVVLAAQNQPNQGSCRLVCDPYQPQGSSHHLGTNGIVIPLSSAGGGGLKGPQGPPGKAGPPGPPGPPGSMGKGQPVPQKGGAVGFHVALKQTFENNDVLKFQDVVLNVGDAYQPLTGIFTCPTSGLYHFSFNVVKMGQRIRVELVSKNTVVATAAAVDMVNADTATGGAVLQLVKGDQVFLQLAGNSDKTLMDTGNRFSTFMGYLIHEL